MFYILAVLEEHHGDQLGGFYRVPKTQATTSESLARLRLDIPRAVDICCSLSKGNKWPKTPILTYLFTQTSRLGTAALTGEKGGKA